MVTLVHVRSPKKQISTSALFTVVREKIDLMSKGRGELRLFGCNLFWVITPISEKKVFRLFANRPLK